MTADTNDKLSIAVRHLVHVIGLCQTPRDSWTLDDSRVLREAREFVQQHREDISESKREETSTTAPAEPAQQPSPGTPEGGVSGEGVSVEAGTEGAPNADD